jgi:hypothetical protein
MGMRSERVTSSDVTGISPDMPALYEIRVRGTLDQTWCGLLDGMTLEAGHEDGQPVTALRVVVQDQAALAGLLDALFGINVTVLSVVALEAA